MKLSLNKAIAFWLILLSAHLTSCIQSSITKHLISCNESKIFHLFKLFILRENLGDNWSVETLKQFILNDLYTNYWWEK